MFPFKNNILSRIVILFLFIEAVSIFLFLGFCVYKLLFFKKMLNGLPALPGETVMIADISKIGFRLIFGLMISCLLLFLFWLYRLYRNIDSTKNLENGFTPVSSVLALVVPFANLLIPRNTVNEICNSYIITDNEKVYAKRILTNWRILFAVVTICSLYCITMFYTPISVSEVVKGIYYKIFLLVIYIHFSFLTMEIVELLNELERKRKVSLLV